MGVMAPLIKFSFDSHYFLSELVR